MAVKNIRVNDPGGELLLVRNGAVVLTRAAEHELTPELEESGSCRVVKGQFQQSVMVFFTQILHAIAGAKIADADAIATNSNHPHSCSRYVMIKTMWLLRIKDHDTCLMRRRKR